MEAPTKLTNLQIVKLANALNSLDGIRLSQIQFEPFQFNPETSWRIANNIAVVGPHIETFNRAKKQLGAQYQLAEGMPITAENAQKVSDFMAALDGLEQKTVDVPGLEMISKDKLNVGGDAKKVQNRIPPTVLAALVPILEA